MSTVRSSHDNQRIVLHSKGAPEIVLGHCTSFRDADGSIKPLTMGKRKDSSYKIYLWTQFQNIIIKQYIVLEYGLERKTS